DLLTRYSWPGNVRELRNVAEQTVVLVRQSPVSAEAIRPFLRGVSAGAGVAVTRPPSGATDEVREREVVYGALLELRAELREVRDLVRRLVGSAPAGSAPSDGALMRLPEPRLTEMSPHERRDPFVPEPMPEQVVTYEPPDDPDDGGGYYSAAETTFEIENPLLPLPETIESALAAGLPLPTMEAAESALIREALRRYDGNRRRAADALGISERTLYRKIRDIEGVE
ncbi:MAG TPA: helix-turn-helix domain-containing protein, partial [Rubricoccaceae bacterium]